MKFLLSLLILLWVASLCAQQPVPARFREKILELERIRFEATCAGQPDALAPMLSRDLLYIHSNGLTESYEDFLMHIENGKLRYERMVPAKQQLRRAGPVVLVNGELQVSGALDGKAFEVSLLYTEAFLRSRGKWRLWSWQSTRKP